MREYPKVKYLNKKEVVWNKLEGDKLLVVDVSAVMRTNHVYFDTPENRLSGLYVPNKYRKELSIVLEDEDGYEEKFNTSAMYGLLRLFNQFELDTNVIFCFDSVYNLRKEIDKNYKGNRVKQGNEYYDQVNTVFKILEKSNFTVLMEEGLEADDLINTVVLNNKDDYDHIGVLTNDRDLTHLVDDNVYWLNCIRSRGDIHKGNYEEMLGIPYNTIILYKTLVGDSSDNIKGVKGFGKKTFDKLVEDLESSNLDFSTIKGEELTIVEYLGLEGDRESEARNSYNLVKPMYAEITNCYETIDVDWNIFKGFLRKYKMNSILKYIDTI